MMLSCLMWIYSVQVLDKVGQLKRLTVYITDWPKSERVPADWHVNAL